MSKNIDEMSVFGEYKQKEDRVTAALLQIFKAGGEPMIREIMNAVGLQLPNSDIHIFSQPRNPSGGSRPDGLLRSKFKFNLYIESKLTLCTINENNNQLVEHKKALTQLSDYLLYITPHDKKPDSLNGVYWTSWKALIDSLESYTGNTKIEDPELVNYLVNEFRKLIDNYNLCPQTWDNYEESDQVLILAGSWAEGIACKYNYYMCQNNRSFRPSGYIAFFNNSKISHLFRVTGVPEDNIDITADPRFTDYVKHEEPDLEHGDKRKVVLLIHEAEINIINDKLDKNGEPCPYTYGQPRYTTKSQILKAMHTSEL